jgi:hypothetical protein
VALAESGSEVKVIREVVNKTRREVNNIFQTLLANTGLEVKVSSEVVNSLGEWSTLYSRLCGLSQLRLRGQGQPRGREYSRSERSTLDSRLCIFCQTVSEVKVSSEVVNSLGERSTLYSRLCIISQTGSEVKLSLEVVNSLGERPTLDSRLCILSQHTTSLVQEHFYF